VSVVGGIGADTFEQTGTFNNAATFVGGAGNDVFQFSAVAQLEASSLDGGANTNTIQFTSNGETVVDGNFDRIAAGTVQNIVTANGTNDITLETNAQAAGIVSVFGGTGADTFDASHAAYNLTGVYFNGGGGADDLTGGGSTDTFVFATRADLAAAAAITGNAGNDTISLTTQGQAVLNADFANVTSVQALTFADGTGSSAVLAGTANTAGIASVYGGSGNDTLTVDETIYTAPTFHGADGTDVLILSNSAATLVDTFFTDVLSVASFQTANGANDITLGLEATGAGIATVTGGTGADILNASAMTSAVTLMGGLGADTITGGSGGSRQQGWGGTSTLNVSNDTLTGGAGTDVFVLGDATGNAYGFDSNPAVNYRALITGFAMGTDRFQLWDSDQTGAVTVAADGAIANQMNISVGGLQVYRFNYDNAADTGTLYVAGTTKVVAELTGFTGSGASLTDSHFTIV
jgi:Ca2+-binding RTX toxin-like protein